MNEYDNSVFSDEILIFFAILFFGFLAVVGLTFYLKEWWDNVKYVKMEVRRAGDYREYKCWKRELRAVCLSILPGIYPERAKRILSIFYRGKYRKKAENNDRIVSILAPSIIGIAICAVCLAGSTFAWFTANISTPTQSIQSADYRIEVSVKEGENTVSANSDGTYTLSPKTENNGYSVTLTAKGTASSGYCQIYIDGSELPVYYSENISLNSTLTFTFTLYPEANDTKYVFTAVWGTYSGEANLHNGDTIGTVATISNEDSEQQTETATVAEDTLTTESVTVPATETTSEVTSTTEPTAPVAEPTEATTTDETYSTEASTDTTENSDTESKTTNSTEENPAPAQ